MSSNLRGQGTTWWTWDEVRQYLGHRGPENSTQVWLTRHNIQAVRVWDANAIRAEREGPQH